MTIWERRGRASIPQKMSENGPVVAEILHFQFSGFAGCIGIVGVTGKKPDIDMARHRVGTEKCLLLA